MKGRALIVAIGLLGGCAALDSVTSEVASDSRWPAERALGSDE